jgi:hypothetical protein
MSIELFNSVCDDLFFMYTVCGDRSTLWQFLASRPLKCCPSGTERRHSEANLGVSYTFVESRSQGYLELERHCRKPRSNFFLPCHSVIRAGNRQSSLTPTSAYRVRTVYLFIYLYIHSFYLFRWFHPPSHAEIRAGYRQSSLTPTSAYRVRTVYLFIYLYIHSFYLFRWFHPPSHAEIRAGYRQSSLTPTSAYGVRTMYLFIYLYIHSIFYIPCQDYRFIYLLVHSFLLLFQVISPSASHLSTSPNIAVDHHSHHQSSMNSCGPFAISPTCGYHSTDQPSWPSHYSPSQSNAGKSLILPP